MDKKFGSLREYQERLLARINAQRSTSPATSFLALEIGGEPWVVGLADLSEVLPVPALTPVPNTRPWFAGIANIRGRLYGVADLAAFMGLEPLEAGTESRLVLVHPKHRINAGFLVTRSLGLRNLQAAPEAATNAGEWTAGEYREDAGRVWKELSVRRLVALPAFLEIAGQLAAA
jgi:twitching motility protein PilI